MSRDAMSRGTSCQKARRFAALAPDGALSEFEERLLAAHLGSCPSCSSFAADVALATDALRLAPLEQPRRAVAVPSARSSRRWRIPSRSLLAGAGSVAATLAIVSAIPDRSHSDGAAQTPRPAIVIDASSSESMDQQRQFLSELRDYRNAQATSESELASVRGPGFGAG